MFLTGSNGMRSKLVDLLGKEKKYQIQKENLAFFVQ